MTLPRSLSLLVGALAFASVVDATAKPNVLFIAVDDLRPELRCYGANHIHSPHIDRLARSGILFRRAYCQVAVCGASRASLLSGCRPETTRCWDFKTPLRSKMPYVLTLPQHFKENGYQTASLGKIYHSRKDDQTSWTVDTATLVPPRPGMGKGYANPDRTDWLPHPTIKGLSLGSSTENGGDVPDERYHDGEAARRAVELMGRLKAADEPFFLAVGFLKPHLPFNAPARYWDLYDRSAIEIPSRENVIGSPKYARSSWGELKNYPDIGRKSDPLDDAKTRELIHGYYAAVSYMDAQVGRLLDGLESLGIADETVVVLWGDHGYYLGDFGDWCKHTNYEVATRVPLVFRAPGKQAGQTTEALVELIDIYPTLCALTGIPIPDHCRGSSLAPLLEDGAQPWKEAAYSQYIKKTPSGSALGTSVRTDRFRYTEWRMRDTGKVDSVELIDFENDPGATRNIAGDPSYAAFLPRLAELAAQSGSGVKP